jgi:hypothetical protein
MFFDSKHGTVVVSLKEREGSLDSAAEQIARTLRLHFGTACFSVLVEDHNGQIIADGRGL